MTLAPPSARGRDDAYRNDSFRDDEDDDGSVAMFAPSLPPRRRSDAPRYAPRPEPAPAAPVPAPPARPSSPLAELFAEEEADAAAAAASQQTDQQTRRRGEERGTAEPVRPSPSPAVTMRAEPRAEADEPSVAAEPIWVGVARGVAAALAAGTLTGAALALRAAPAGPAWLADLAPLPDAALAPLLAFCGTALGLFAVKTNLPTPPRWGATLAAAAVAGGALWAAIAGGLAAGFGPSLAWQIVVCAGLILAATRWSPGAAAAGSVAVRAGRLAPVIGLLVCGLTFPLADGALGDLPTDARGPAAAGRAIAGWWADALRFEPTDAAK